MTTPIIIETTTTTRERLVLVPGGTCTDYEDKPGRVRLVTTDGRDATPADLERAGWVLREVPSAAAQPAPGTLAHLRNDLRDAVNERDDLRHHYDAAGPEHNLLALLDSYESDADTARAEASAAYAMVVAAIGSVGAETIEAAVARLVADRGALVARAEKAEAARDALRDQIAAAGCEAAHAGERTYECDVARPCGLCRLRTRAEKAERERDEALLRAHTGVVHYEILRQSGEEAARQRDEARAELARLTAPGEGSEGEPTDNDLRDVWGPESTMANARRAIYRLGVAHERARQPEKGRATALRAELERLTAPGEPTDAELRASRTRPRCTSRGTRSHAAPSTAPSGAPARSPAPPTSLDDMRKVALAVAARVRKERCLVAQAVAANVDIRVAEDDGGGFMVGVHAPGCDEELARCVPAADVPATLARLLGEVSR